MLEDTEATKFPAIHMNVINNLLNNDQFLGLSGSFASLKANGLGLGGLCVIVSASLVAGLMEGVPLSISSWAAIVMTPGMEYFT